MSFYWWQAGFHVDQGECLPEDVQALPILKAASRVQHGDPHITPSAQHVTSNPSDIFLLYEEKFNKRTAELPTIDWASFPTLDCLVFSALQWGHSYRDEPWGGVTGEQQEYKIQIPEKGSL